MTEFTLFDLNSSKEFVEELDSEESKLIVGGQVPAEPSGGSSGGEETGGSSGGEETGGSIECTAPPDRCV